MNLENCYVPNHPAGAEVYQAVQFTGPECLEPGHAFLTYLGQFVNTTQPDVIVPLDGGTRFLFTMSGTTRLIAAGNWLTSKLNNSYPEIEDNGYFIETYKPLVEKLNTVPSALSRANAVGNKVYRGPVEVQEFVAQLRAEQRLTAESVDQLLKSDRMVDSEVTAQIYSIQRDGEVNEELAVCLPYSSPVTIRLNSPTPSADGAMGHDAIIELCEELNRTGRLTDSLLLVVQSLPHLDHVDVMMTVVDQNIKLSASDCTTVELPLVVTQNRSYDSVDQMFDRFFQLMKVKHGEMGPIKLDHRTLMEELSKTLVDDEDEDQFIKIAIYAMGLQEVGGFTVGQLIHANELDEPSSDEPELIDLGNEFEDRKE